MEAVGNKTLFASILYATLRFWYGLLTRKVQSEKLF